MSYSEHSSLLYSTVFYRIEQDLYRRFVSNGESGSDSDSDQESEIEIMPMIRNARIFTSQASFDAYRPGATDQQVGIEIDGDTPVSPSDIYLLCSYGIHKDLVLQVGHYIHPGDVLDG